MSESDKTKAQLLDELKALRNQITKLERSETELRKSEQELRIMGHAVASSLSGVGITDMDGNMIYVNDTLLKMWRFNHKNEVIGRHVTEFWAGDGVQDTIKALYKKGGMVGEDVGKRKDGSLFNVQFIASVIKDKSGRPQYMYGSFIDISDRKEAEEKIQKAYELMEQRVEERTKELKEANIIMKLEIKERMRFEKALKEREEELQKQTIALEQKNVALREVIAQIEIEKRKIQDDVMANVHLTITPILERFRLENVAPRRIAMLRHHISDLTSSFGSEVTKKNMNLTAKEIEICNMVKAGLSNKDISQLQNISQKTVEGHRKRIRQKLGLTGRKINLTSYLRRI